MKQFVQATDTLTRDTMITIIDMGSQYTHVIWRTVRDLGHEARIVQKNAPLQSLAPSAALILSGGPSSVNTDNFFDLPHAIKKIHGSEWKMPLLGICLGQQLIAHVLGGKVQRGKSAEYGLSKITIDSSGTLLASLPREFSAWVSHFDEVVQPPAGFVVLAHSQTCACEAMEDAQKNIFATQFHPEVWHTQHGEQILGNFLSRMRKTAEK